MLSLNCGSKIFFTRFEKYKVKLYISRFGIIFELSL